MNVDIFRMLGDYYSSKAGLAATEKARRCYQEAFRINPWSDKIGEKLSDTLRLLNDTVRVRTGAASIVWCLSKCNTPPLFFRMETVSFWKV